jgi:hypothetical protein
VTPGSIGWSRYYAAAVLRLRRVAAVASLLVVLGACSGDSEADSKQLDDLKAQLAALKKQEREAKSELASIEEDGAVESDATTTTVDSEVSADASAVGLTYYTEEFKVTVRSTEVKPDPNNAKRATLEILLDCENVGGSDGFCPGDARIESKNEFYSVSDTDLPLVPSGRKGNGALRFTVDDKFSLADAVLRVGSAPRHVVVVPLCPGPNSPETVLLAPVDLAVAGSMETGQVVTTIKKVRLAVDHPNHRTRDAKFLTMYITMDLAAKVTEEYKGYFLEYGAYDLKLPNGNTAEAEAWSIQSSFINADHTEPDVVIRYEVPNPPAGTYQLQYTPPARGEQKPEPATIAFTI